MSEAIQNRSPKLQPLERSKLRELIEQDHLHSATFQLGDVALWGANTLGADLAVVGTLERASDAIHVNVRIIGHDPKKRIALENRQLDWTDERRAWQEQSLPHFPPVIPWKDVPSVQSGGYSRPVCVSCPRPPYTEEARKATFQGNAMALLLIGDDGSVREVMLVQGLPCGLSSRIVSTLKGWRFQPITGPDSRPAVVQTQVEITFRFF